MRHDAGDRFQVASAGVDPIAVKPEAIQVMREIGIDISSHRSKSVDEFTDQRFDYVITVCDKANERCPIFPGNTKRIHWSFEDPAAAIEEPDVTVDQAEVPRIVQHDTKLIDLGSGARGGRPNETAAPRKASLPRATAPGQGGVPRLGSLGRRMLHACIDPSAWA